MDGLFFNKDSLHPLCPLVSHSRVFNLLCCVFKGFLICSWESADTEDRLYELFCATVCRGLEHPRVWASTRVWEPTPCRCWGMAVVKFGGNQKIYADFWWHGGTPTLVLFTGHLYKEEGSNNQTHSDLFNLALNMEDSRPWKHYSGLNTPCPGTLRKASLQWAKG